MFKVSTSLFHACLQSLTKVLDTPFHRFFRKVAKSSPVLFEAPQLLVVTCPACDKLSAWHPTHDNQAD